MRVGLLHHLLHVHQMTRIGREVVLNTLLVADVYQDMVEESCGASVADGYGQTALEHILQESHRLQTHRLATRIRPRDNQESFLLGEDDIQWHHVLSLLLQRELQQGMHGADPVQMRLVFHHGLESLGEFSQLRLGENQVDLRQELIRLEDLSHMRTHLVGKHRQDTDHLATLLGLQLTHLIVGLHHFGRFDKHGLSRGTLIVHDTVDPAFHLRRHGQHQSTVAHRRGSIFLHQSVFLGSVQDRI